MTTITIDELPERLRDVIEQIASTGEPVEITRDGIAVAEINPTSARAHTETQAGTPWTEEERQAYWAEWDRIGREISKSWPAGVSAVDAIREDRSRLDDFLARNDDR